MTAEEIDGPARQFLLRAVAVSLAVHLAVFSLWKVGQDRGWWRHLALPGWMQLVSKTLLPAIKIPAHPRSQTVPLMFVDTDPALAVKEPPKQAKFYGANNTLAANPDIQKLSQDPNVNGRQDKVPKPTDADKAQPLQPSPPKPDNEKETAEAKPLPKKAETMGDLAFAKPQKTAQPKDGPAESDAGSAAQPEPAHQRPRTIEEALQQRGMTGQKSRQSGGVKNHNIDSSFDTMGTSYGDYDAEFIAAVKTRWDQLLQNHLASAPGRVVVEFSLLPTGQIRNLKIAENTVDELSGVICAQAISDPAPYRPWPRQMRLDLPSDHREVRFTFYYSND